MKKAIKVCSIVLAICLLAFVFAACDDKKGGEDNNGATNNLPQITLADDMTLDEIKEALDGVYNYYFKMQMNGEIYEYWCDENGFVLKITNINKDSDGYGYTTYYGTFIDGDKGYDLGRDAKDGKTEYYEYYFGVVTEERKAELKEEINFLSLYLNDSARVENGKLIILYDCGEDELTQIEFSDFNKITLPTDESFPNFRELAVEYVDEEE